MRKCIVLAIMALVSISTALAGTPKAKHVVLIGLDGWGAYSVRKADPTTIPNIRKVMERGAWTLRDRAVLPSSSAINWATMFMGVPTEIHGYTNWNSKKPEIKPNVTNERGIQPTIFSELRRQRPDARIEAFVEWDVYEFLMDKAILDNFHLDPGNHQKLPDALVAEACAGAPLYDFVAPDGIRHTVWEIAYGHECRADELVELFARIPVAYIADGHHRSAAASRYAREQGFAGESRWFLAVAFPASQLRILPYNRLVADLNGLTVGQFLEQVKARFTVTAAADGVPAAGRHARMFLAGAWYDLAWEVPAGTDVVSALDVSVLQDRLLAPVLGIGDPRTSPRISFMGGVRPLAELQERVADGRDAVAFSMYPVTVGEMMAIADAGAVMPPKSTWFEPKLRSGLFVHAV